MTNQNLPKLSEAEQVRLWDFRRNNPREFTSNVTMLFLSELRQMIRDRFVFRMGIMGEPRTGKSEMGSTIAMIYARIFNEEFERPEPENMILKGMKEFSEDDKKHIQFKKIEFNINNVYDNQQVYKQNLKDRHKSGNLIYGMIHQIDEEKTSIGGVGSFSDMIESQNLNNIVAKFWQSEIWIKPLELETKNCRYGIHVIKKDIINACNWGILSRLERHENGSVSFIPMGWINIPLHHNTKFREDYNALKNKWINKELSGRVDERQVLQHETAIFLVKNYREFFEFKETKGGQIKSKYTSDWQEQFLRSLIYKGEINTNFNKEELYWICLEARQIVEFESGVKR